jgi:uncharacterized protein
VPSVERRIRPRWIGLSALIAALATQANAQGFDCARAVTPTEHEICASPQLRVLDSALTDTLQHALIAAAAQRAALLADERAWLRQRDQCAAAPAPADCLTSAYRARIIELRNLPPATAATAQGATCRTVLERYRPLAESHPGEFPLKVLAGTPGAGVTLSADRMALDKSGTLIDWARAQHPAFEVDPAIAERIDGFYSGGALEHLPGTNFYAVLQVEGTAHCYDSVYFTLEHGHTNIVRGPPGFDDEAPSCGARRSFGAVDKRPVFFEEDYGFTPSMQAAIIIATWKDGAFSEDCSITLTYAPHFAGNAPDWDQDQCSGEDCAQLRRAALELVQAVQQDPPATFTRLRAQLTPEQMAQFRALATKAATRVPQSDPEAAPDADPATILDTAPLELPYVLEGRVYRVSLAHFTIGWREYADWGVTFRSGTGDELRVAEFALAMQKGRLLDARVSAQ